MYVQMINPMVTECSETYLCTVSCEMYVEACICTEDQSYGDMMQFKNPILFGNTMHQFFEHMQWANPIHVCSYTYLCTCEGSIYMGNSACTKGELL